MINSRLHQSIDYTNRLGSIGFNSIRFLIIIIYDLCKRLLPFWRFPFLDNKIYWSRVSDRARFWVARKSGRYKKISNELISVSTYIFRNHRLQRPVNSTNLTNNEHIPNLNTCRISKHIHRSSFPQQPHHISKDRDDLEHMAMAGRVGHFLTATNSTLP